jgi:hypothetical protein
MIRLSIRVTKDQSAALLALRNGPARVMQRLGFAFRSGAQEVLGRAVKNRFTGKGPFPVAENRLGVVTNRMRKSMRATALQVNASSGQASLSMGSNVSYYAGHEFGFRGRVQIKGHTRKAVRGNSRRDFQSEYSSFRGKLTKSTSRALKGNLKRGRANFSYVKPHTRNVRIPRRRPLGTELDSIQTRLTFYQKFNAAIRRILKIN